ncbi:exodeoxyribonuclease III [Gordonia sp. X0973]|uniref:exodeoxyribonuclease III n=1 Tax=Gordonia sp. X0973 TaxID=2742602 RepID=UPI000F524021|nr:exodeoxyribonuclease III [Gordonia sp. X0973]QKT06123.1 exodeoxyribonuclease III [Gordonia sp. X0973]
MRLATWNVNSIRARSESIVAWAADSEIDVLALQETKCTDDGFPVMSFLAAGYDVAFTGNGGYNGVAIASRVGLDAVEYGFEGQPEWEGAREARAISAVCDGVRVWSLYVPNGRAPGDPHFSYKVEWLGALRDRAALWLAHDPAAQIALAGDWNVAPTDADVWDPAEFAGKSHVTDEERAAFGSFADAGYADAAQPYLEREKTFTFWDYQQLRFPRNQGMKIDFVLCSPALNDRVFGAAIDKAARKAPGASDHAPVVLDVR